MSIQIPFPEVLTLPKALDLLETAERTITGARRLDEITHYNTSEALDHALTALYIVEGSLQRVSAFLRTLEIHDDRPT